MESPEIFTKGINKAQNETGVDQNQPPITAMNDYEIPESSQPHNAMMQAMNPKVLSE